MITKNQKQTSVIFNVVKKLTKLSVCLIFGILTWHNSLAQIYLQPSLGPSITYADYGKINLTSNTGVLIADSRLSQISLGFNTSLEVAYQFEGFALGIKAIYINTATKTAEVEEVVLPVNDKAISTYAVGPMLSLQLGKFDLSLSTGISAINIDNVENGYYINPGIAYRLGKFSLGVDYQFSRFTTVLGRTLYHTTSLVLGYTIDSKK